MYIRIYIYIIKHNYWEHYLQQILQSHVQNSKTRHLPTPWFLARSITMWQFTNRCPLRTIGQLGVFFVLMAVSFPAFGLVLSLDVDHISEEIPMTFWGIHQISGKFCYDMSEGAYTNIHTFIKWLKNRQQVLPNHLPSLDTGIHPKTAGAKVDVQKSMNHRYHLW